MRLASILQPGERCKELDCTKDVQMATGESLEESAYGFSPPRLFY